METALRYRRHAAECRERARATIDESARKVLGEAAEVWERLANSREEMLKRWTEWETE